MPQRRRGGRRALRLAISNWRQRPKATFTEMLPAALTTGAPRELSYFVEVRNSNGRSAGMSNAAVVLAGEAPGPVTGLQAEVRKEGVRAALECRGTRSAAPTAIRLHRKLLTHGAREGERRAEGTACTAARACWK